MNVECLIETAEDPVDGVKERLCSIKSESRLVKNAKSLSCAITININEKGRCFKGFGGALTESAGFVLSKMPEQAREEAIRAYFGSGGIGYTVARTHMNSCDFSLENWACVQKKDESLESFSMERTDLYITPLVQEAQKLCKDESGKNLCVMVSPWSPPAWMKDNNDMNHGGHLKKEYLALWAYYFVRFLTELKKREIEVGFVSIQNEPAATQTWDSCIWTGEEEGEFAVKYLRPALDKNGFLQTGILVWDHNRDLLFKRFSASMGIPGAEKAIAGAAYHWYMGANYENVEQTANSFPGKELVFSEGSIEGGSRNGAWFSGERYAHNIINDLNHGCTMWIDWNIALDMNGGPNHANNFCDAPILLDEKNGMVNYQSSYYYIGHFSRYIKRGAVHLGVKMDGFMTPATVDGIMGDMMESTAFLNEDGTIVVVVCNRTESEMYFSLNLVATDQVNKSIELHNSSSHANSSVYFCPPRAIQTFSIRV